jgi:hypothetical protein
LAQEIELRLEQSLEAQHWLRDTLELAFDRQTAAVILAIGCTVQSAATSATLLASPTPSWLSNAFVFRQVINSVNELLELLKPDGDASQLPSGLAAELLGGDTKAKALLENFAGHSAKQVAEDIAGLFGGYDPPADLDLDNAVTPLGSWRSMIRDWLGDAAVAQLGDRLRSASLNPDPSPNSALGDSLGSEKIMDNPQRVRGKRSKPERPK